MRHVWHAQRRDGRAGTRGCTLHRVDRVRGTVPLRCIKYQEHPARFTTVLVKSEVSLLLTNVQVVLLMGFTPTSASRPSLPSALI